MQNPLPQTAKQGIFYKIDILVAFCRKLCYAVFGATSSTLVGGSPLFFGGEIYFFFCPRSRERGYGLMVTWEELFQFCMVIATVIALVRQDNDNKKK